MGLFTVLTPQLALQLIASGKTNQCSESNLKAGVPCSLLRTLVSIQIFTLGWCFHLEVQAQRASQWLNM